MWKNWQQWDEEMSDHLINFVCDDSDGWRAFVQRRANIISKGSLTIIQRALRLRPAKDGLDPDAAQALQDLQEEVESLREKVRKAEETAQNKLGKENVALEGKLTKTEDKNIDLRIVAEQLQSDKLRMNKDLDAKMEELRVLEDRAGIAERSVAAQRQEQEELRRRVSEADERRLSAVADKVAAEKAQQEAKDARIVMEEQLGKRSSEAELLAGGVHEMMVELKKSDVARRRAHMQTKEAQAEIKTLTAEVSKMKAQEAEVQEAIGRVAQAEEKAAEVERKAEERVVEAERKEAAATATLELKTDAVER